MSDPAIQKLSDSIDNLKNDMAKIGILVDRLDVTIEKLTEVSTNVSQLLAIQGSRLEFQEKLQEKLQDTLEKRRQETDAAIVKLHEKVDTVQKDTGLSIEKSKTNILTEISDIKNIITKQHESENERITKIETWMWLIMGGSVVLAFILNKIDLTALF